MDVLVTTDTISGFPPTRELVSGLVSRGLRVTLVSFGEVPLPEQASWMWTACMASTTARPGFALNGCTKVSRIMLSPQAT